MWSCGATPLAVHGTSAVADQVMAEALTAIEDVGQVETTG